MKALPVRLDGELSIYRAAELRNALLAPLGAGIMIELDLSAATEIDTAGVQLLLLAKTTARAGGGDLRLLAASAPVLGLLELLGLHGDFGHPAGVPPSATWMTQ